MLPAKKILMAASVVALVLISVGCQKIEARSDQWKQEKIMTMYRQYIPEFPQVEGITVEELQQLQQEQPRLILVDVRSPEERAVSSIPGSISTEEFEHQLAEYQDTKIIAYCTIGYRSGKYAQKMRQQGVEILNLEGSLLAWSHIQGRLSNRNGITRKVHVFNRQWGLTAADYEPVW